MLFMSPTLVSTSSTVWEIRWWIGRVDPRGRAIFCSVVRVARTVRVAVADGPRAACSSRVRRVLTRLCFRSSFVLGFRCSRFTNGPSFSSGRFGTRADGPPGLRGRSVFLGSILVVLLSLTDGPWLPAGRSAVPCDCPRHLAGLSVRPLRTVRLAWPDSPPEVDSSVL
jgi:hypothetical protein